MSGTFDYVRFCGTATEERLAEENRISAKELAVLLDQPAALSLDGHGTSESQARGDFSPAGSNLLLDVRPRPQFALCNLAGSVNIPLPDLMAARSLDDVDRLVNAQSPRRETLPEETIAICRLGNDSQAAVRQLQSLRAEQGIEAIEHAGLKHLERKEMRVRDVKGGFKAWRAEVDRSWPDY